MFTVDWQGFENWLRRQGAEVLVRTNPFEVVRFRAKSAVHIVYRDGSGCISSVPEFVQKCLDAFKNGRNLGMGITKQPRTLVAKKKAALFERDGDKCFFCGKSMTFEEASVEHLVAVVHGGPSNMNNYVLAHRACNEEVNNLPLKEKIDIHVSWRLLEEKLEPKGV